MDIGVGSGGGGGQGGDSPPKFQVSSWGGPKFTHCLHNCNYILMSLV